MTYRCALSATRAKAEDLVTDADDGDDLEDMPVGWRRVTVERRIRNPERTRILAGIETLISIQMAPVLAAIPEDEREAQAEDLARTEDAIRLSEEARFYALLQDTPEYLTEPEEAYIADTDASPAVKREWASIAKALELDEP